jgi:fibronectin type 3 domain-containing protein
MTNCASIQALLVPGSPEWIMVEQGLADSTTLFNPCDIASIPPGTNKHAMLQLLARGNEKIARVAGLGYNDGTVVNGTTYYYRIVGVNGGGTETGVLDDNVSVTAGTVVALPAPGGLVAEGGDSEILIRWDDVTNAAGYRVLRSTVNWGFFKPVNQGGFTLKVTQQLNGDTLIPATNGFLDFRRYDTDGKPTYHEVNGSNVYGPNNGITYYYKLQSVDLLGRPGPMSASFVSAVPQDSTPPATPGDIQVVADEPSNALTISWTRVLSDVNGNEESPAINKYMLYRYEHAEDDPFSTGTLVNGNIAPPANPQVLTVSYDDNSPGLRSDHGEKTWWYRVIAVDDNGNESQVSMAAGGALKDITAPDIVKNLTTDGFETHISLSWQANNEPDMDGYMIYRSLCHFDEWVPCPEKDERPGKPTHDDNPSQQGKDPEICSGPFVYLGMVDQDSAKKAISSGNWIYEDRSIPEGSPLCYAYWIKAVDKSGNQSGDWPMPSPAELIGIECERLRDKTPPEPALISGLFARDDAIRVEWIGPPTQDTRAYHVYRALGKDGQNEPDPADFSWVGGMTVEPPPGVPVPLAAPYAPTQPANCGVIPVAASEYMSHGTFLDKNLDPKEIYWYKVVGIDYDGNEGELKEAIPVSTFTFSSELANTPVIASINEEAEPCALVLTWAPAFDANKHIGFVVFRSRSKWDGYNQIADMVQENAFVDTQVAKGVEYWYRIALLDIDGTVSEMTVPVSAKANP